jgi:hypothetical protein
MRALPKEVICVNVQAKLVQQSRREVEKQARAQAATINDQSG